MRRVPAAFQRWLLLLHLLVVAFPVRGAGDPLPVFSLTNGQASVILLGSVHMAYESLYPLRDDIEQAFANADALVVEVDVSGDKGERIKALFRERGTLPAGQRLQDHLSDESLAALDAYLAERNLPLELFESLRPGLVVLTLSSLRLEELGLDARLGIEQHFLRQLAGEQRVIELESAEQQVELLLDFPEADQLMARNLRELEQAEDTLQPLYTAWLAGDLDELDRLLLREERAANPQFEPIYERLYDERNRDMTRKISDLMTQEGQFFVIVGAGHLVGEQGIIQLLERAGFSPQRF